MSSEWGHGKSVNPGLLGTPLRIFPDVDGQWGDVEDGRKVHHLRGEGLAIGGLAGGMKSGAASVMVRVDLPNGETVLAETSLALFLSAADALKARHGDPR
jgi:hypothetical protein